MHAEDKDMPELLKVLNTKMSGAVVELELVYKKSIMHYTEKPTKFIKVYM